jgi:hypothetical protein
MHTLEELLHRCQEDTARICSQGAANRLGNWRRYKGNQPELIAFIQRCIRGNESRLNGWLLDIGGGLSLERIVLDHCSQLFDESDLWEARRTLKLEKGE